MNHPATLRRHNVKWRNIVSIPSQLKAAEPAWHVPMKKPINGGSHTIMEPSLVVECRISWPHGYLLMTVLSLYHVSASCWSGDPWFDGFSNWRFDIEWFQGLVVLYSPFLLLEGSARCSVEWIQMPFMFHETAQEGILKNAVTCASLGSRNNFVKRLRILYGRKYQVVYSSNLEILRVIIKKKNDFPCGEP